MTPDEVRRVAVLARLALTDAEAERLAQDFAAVLAHLDRLRDVDLGGTERTYQAVDLADVLRADEPEPGLPHAEATAGAPDVAEGCFRVPRVLPAEDAPARGASAGPGSA